MNRRGILAALACLLLVGAAAPAAGASSAHSSVIGGSVAGHGTFPYMAFVVREEGAEVGLCSGTVVSSNLILTAAHCVVDAEHGQIRDPSTYAVVTGNVEWASPERVVSAVTQIVVNPNYTYAGEFQFWGDAALCNSRPRSTRQRSDSRRAKSGGPAPPQRWPDGDEPPPIKSALRRSCTTRPPSFRARNTANRNWEPTSIQSESCALSILRVMERGPATVTAEAPCSRSSPARAKSSRSASRHSAKKTAQRRRPAFSPGRILSRPGRATG